MVRPSRRATPLRGAVLVGCCAALSAQADGRFDRLRDSVQQWFSARAADTDPERLRLLAADVQRAWPSGASGRNLLADTARLRELFASAFAYRAVDVGAGLVSLPRASGVKVYVPASYRPDRAVPVVLRLWPGRRELGPLSVETGPEPGPVTAIVVSATVRQVEAMVRVVPRRDLLGAMRDGGVAALDRLGATGLAARLAAREPDPDLVQRGLFALLGELQRQFHVDRDRLVLDCAGDACRSGLRAVTSAPDRFAGLVLRALPRLATDALDNLAGVPVLILRGAGTADEANALRRRIDRITDVEVWDSESAGAGRVALWCDERRRELMPSRVSLAMRDDTQVDGFWVSDVIAGSANGDGAGPARIDVSIDRARGEIRVECRRVDRFTLLLNDQLLDLDRPFLLDVNGIAVMMRRTPSFSYLCETVFERFDPGFLFTTEITVDVPRRG